MKWKQDMVVWRGNKVLTDLGILGPYYNSFHTCLFNLYYIENSYIHSYRREGDNDGNTHVYLSLTQKDGRCEYSIRIIKERYLPKYQTKTEIYVLL